MPNTTAIIPVRKGSKRIKKKNIREFKGQPLLVWSIKAALQTPGIDTVIVSTDDEEAAEIAREYPVTVFMRPEELASDTASTFNVLKHVCLVQCKGIDLSPEIVMLLQATSPLREKDLLSNGLRRMEEDPTTDRLIELNKFALFTGSVDSGYWIGDFPETTRSQDLPFLYFPSGRLYIYRCSSTIAKNDPGGGRTGFVFGEYETNINVDYEADFDKLEYVFTRYGDRYQYLLN